MLTIYIQRVPANGSHIQSIKIVPNPANTSAEIILEKGLTGICMLDVTDALGKQLMTASFNCSDNIYTLDTNSLKPGIYTVRIVLNDLLVHTEKLIIVR